MSRPLDTQQASDAIAITGRAVTILGIDVFDLGAMGAMDVTVDVHGHDDRGSAGDDLGSGRDDAERQNAFRRFGELVDRDASSVPVARVRPTRAIPPRPILPAGGSPMNVIKVTVPPDSTPEEEEQLVAEIAASYAESTGSDDVTIETTRSEEVDYRSLQTGMTSRWAG